jgi:glutamyl-tRNA reductase
VAAGLDSLVVGEPQIRPGEVASPANDLRTTGADNAVSSAFASASACDRNGAGRGAVSVTGAIALAKIFGSLEACTS